jgi:hypothetical protein
LNRSLAIISVSNIEKAGRKAWLAGLGSFVFGKEYATSKIDQVYTETTQLVTNLMSAGEKLKESNEHKFPDVDQRILQIREKLGLDNRQPDQLQELEARVSQLTDVVNKLVDAKSAEALKEIQVKKPRAPRAKAAPKAADTETEAATKASTTRRRAPAKKSTATAAKPSTVAKKPTTRKAAAPKAAPKSE